jgi:polyhydroxyalkanoate synthase
MTTEEFASPVDTEKLNENLQKIEDLSQRLMAAFGRKRAVPQALQGPGPDLMMKTAAAYMADVMANPSKLFEQQVALWGKSLQHFIEAQEQLAKGKFEAPEDSGPNDRRFANPLWDTHPYFNFVKQQYLINADATRDAIEHVEGLEPKDKKRLEFFSGQILDLMSPTNFFGTNPEALQRAVETDGQSLVDGLENLVNDLEANDGELLVTLADKNAFKVGGNIATTPGSVVFRNRMFELIQYKPTTEQVHETPLVIFPPWINKFYVMDLKDQNSLIKWIVDQGFTLFVVSWVNPDASYAEVGMDTYIEEGYLTAIAEAKKIAGVKTVNVVGYCIAGTTLALVLSLLKKRGDSSINAATFFTALTDFSDQGEFGVFLDDDFVDGIEEEVNEHGFLESFFMARTFSFLRSRDLVYGPAIKSYMMGEAPPAFDLLFWNGDGTNLPARMAVEYLRWLCQGNLLAEGKLELLGETLSLADVDVPVCSIACETDHIAAWKDCYRGVQQMGSDEKTFILSESGHIAGIINPPSKKKYGHFTNPDLGLEFGDWKDSADFNEGSWWPRWGQWLSGKSGPMVAAREPGDKDHPILAAAPGEYVVKKPSH